MLSPAAAHACASGHAEKPAKNAKAHPSHVHSFTSVTSTGYPCRPDLQRLPDGSSGHKHSARESRPRQYSITTPARERRLRCVGRGTRVRSPRRTAHPGRPRGTRVPPVENKGKMPVQPSTEIGFRCFPTLARGGRVTRGIPACHPGELQVFVRQTHADTIGGGGNRTHRQSAPAIAPGRHDSQLDSQSLYVPPLPSDLNEILDAWRALTESQRGSVLAMVRGFRHQHGGEACE